MEIESPNPQAVVFVVDDDAAVRDSMSSLIRSVGLRVELFGTAAEFLARKLPAAPCCLVLDVRLPRLSGLDLQAEMAKANIQIPIILITKHGDIPLCVCVLEWGPVEYLT